MSMQKSGNVAVFWDYENCPLPANTSGYAIANSISALARSYGSVKLFKAYLEISDQSRSSLRSELQSSGVSLVDCPHNGRKDVADKMILVDMLSYAIDNPAPSTILLITSDRDFAYALSILKNRHYRLVLVKRPDTHVSLTFQACICFDWFDDVVHQAENPSSQVEQRPQRHRQCSDIICNAPSLRPTPWRPATGDSLGSGADTEGTLDIVHCHRDRISDRVPPTLQEHPQVSTATDEPPRQDQGISSSSQHRRGPSFSTGHSTSYSSLAQEKQQTSLKTPKHQSTQPETPCIMLPPPKDDSAVIRDVPALEPLSSTPASRSAHKGDAHTTKPTGTFPKLLEPTKDVFSSISPLSSPIMWFPTIPNSAVAQRTAHEETKAVKSTLPPSTPPISAEELAEKFLREPTINTMPISPPSANPPCSKLSTPCATIVDSVKPRIEYSVPQKPTDAKPASPTSSNDSWVTFQTAPGPTEPLATPVVPPNFVILVEALQWQRCEGVFLPSRSSIAARISKKGATYQKAGVSSFRQYSLLAEQAGIVEMGGADGRDWISLKPKWHNVHAVEPTAIPPSTG